jgi:hypothetical protein
MESELEIVNLPKNYLSITKENGVYILSIEGIRGYERLDGFGNGFRELRDVEGIAFKNFFNLLYSLGSKKNKGRRELILSNLEGLKEFEEKAIKRRIGLDDKI